MLRLNSFLYQLFYHDRKRIISKAVLLEINAIASAAFSVSLMQRSDCVATCANCSEWVSPSFPALFYVKEKGQGCF